MQKENSKVNLTQLLEFELEKINCKTGFSPFARLQDAHASHVLSVWKSVSKELIKYRLDGKK